MANFICCEAAASDESDDEVEQLEIDNLIDDSETQENNNASFFRFHNQTTDTDEVLREAAEIEASADQHKEANNYNEYGREIMPLDEFESFEKKESFF